MPLKRLKTLNTRVVHTNPYWQYKLDRYSLPGGGEGNYHYVVTPGSVLIVPLREDGRLVMVRQYRYLCKKESVEFPSGGVKEHSFLIAAKNELAEEAKLAASKWKQIGEFNPFNGVTNEFCKVYLASGLSAAEKEKDVSEEFEILSLSVDEIRRRIRSGAIWDGMTLAAFSIADMKIKGFGKRK